MLNLSSGRSKKDRISFYTSYNGATAIRKENGEIAIEFGKQNISLMKALCVLVGIFCTLSLIKVYVLIPLIESKTIGVIWYLIPIFVYSFLLIFSIISVRKKGGKEFLKNHGAEHMVLAAYKKFKKVPTIEETRQFCRISPNCGTTIYSAFITSQLIGFIVYIATGYKLSEILLFLIPLFFNSVFPLNFIGKLCQFLTTTKPEDSNIELAISALSALESRENLVNVVSNTINNLNFTSNHFSQSNYDEEISDDKWHCVGDCQYFSDFPTCPGENNIDNKSENNCPYYSSEI